MPKEGMHNCFKKFLVNNLCHTIATEEDGTLASCVPPRGRLPGCVCWLLCWAHNLLARVEFMAVVTTSQIMSTTMPRTPPQDRQ